MQQGFDIEAFNALSPEEQKIAMQMLEDLSKGDSTIYDSLISADYKETPADIMTFIHDRKYLGNAWHTAEGKCKLFPYWEGVLTKLFPDPYTTSVNNLIESGARGLGKSEIATTCMLYLMHRLMCLKDPHTYYNIKVTEKFAFAFMNITKDLAESIGISKFQDTVQMSPWFMERGTITGINTKIWNPPDFIDIIIGSQPKHTIGRPIFGCLDGNEQIITTDGTYAIKDLIGKAIKVFCIDPAGNQVVSDECFVQPTTISSTEYQIVLEDNSVIKCTPTHRFLLKDGVAYKEAKDLILDDELFTYKVELHHGTAIKIKTIRAVHFGTPKQYYDVINANPYNNYLMKTNEGTTICSHNCFFDEIN